MNLFYVVNAVYSENRTETLKYWLLEQMLRTATTGIQWVQTFALRG
jgi:hypothetical protein